jgi:TPR repeat protein
MSENYEIGLKYYDEQQYDKALEYFQLAADKSLALAQNNLGNMYFIGNGVEKSYQTAFEYYQLAADQGLAEAQNNLGNMYFNGNGVEQSYHTALEYYQLAADQGLADAQNNVGYMYGTGNGVEKSYQKAVEYYQLAADQGDSYAQNNLNYLKSSKQYIRYELLEQRKINERLIQQIEFLMTDIRALKEEILHLKYQPGGSGYQETKEHFESLT